MPGLAVVGAAGCGVFLGENISKLIETFKGLNKYIYLLQFSGGGAGFFGVFLGGKFKQLVKCINILPLLVCYFAVFAGMGAGWYFYTFVPFVPCLRALFALGASGLRTGASSPARLLLLFQSCRGCSGLAAAGAAGVLLLFQGAGLCLGMGAAYMIGGRFHIERGPAGGR